MLIPMATLAGIAAGRITLAFRRWDRPRVLPGTRLRTTIGLVEMVSVQRVTRKELTAQQARDAGFTSLKELTAFLDRKKAGDVYRIEVRYAGADPRIELRAQAELSDQERATLLEKLAAMDRREPWTMRFLRLIEQQPAVRAPDLAAEIGWETLVFKRHVRKLKELGLTESLEIGYRLSPRGQSLLAST